MFFDYTILLHMSFWLYRKGKFFKRTLRTIHSDPDNVSKVALLLYIEMINAWFAMPL